jgi:sterol desaturase/sphingolipid hydroxylase (fatty acid hydroxylase superfamily)
MLNDYQKVKLICTTASLAACLTLQRIHPYHGRWRDIAANWRINFAVAFINALLLGSLSSSAILWTVERGNTHNFGLTVGMGWSSSARILLSVLALDFTSYLWHIANHKISLFWRFHAVHHTDLVFDTSTALRFHPVEIFLGLIIRCLVILFLGLPIEGVLLFETIFAFFNFLEHADLKLPRNLEWIMGWLFITPALHRKHHSQILAEQNSNFGTIFVLWDRIFRSVKISTSAESIAVGLNQRSLQNLSIKSILLLPFRKNAVFQV